MGAVSVVAVAQYRSRFCSLLTFTLPLASRSLPAQMNFDYNFTNINLVRSFKPLDVNTVDDNDSTEALYDQQATMQPALTILSSILSAFGNSSKVYDPAVLRIYLSNKYGKTNLPRCELCWGATGLRLCGWVPHGACCSFFPQTTAKLCGELPLPLQIYAWTPPLHRNRLGCHVSSVQHRPASAGAPGGRNMVQACRLAKRGDSHGAHVRLRAACGALPGAHSTALGLPMRVSA